MGKTFWESNAGVILLLILFAFLFFIIGIFKLIRKEKYN